MLAREDNLFDFTWSKPNQGSVPAGLTLAGDFGFCFQCQVASSFVLRRPIEITALIRTCGRDLYRLSRIPIGEADTDEPVDQQNQRKQGKN
jgi:hypothetical protein